MDKPYFIQQFATRLRDAMIDAGLHSTRSASGVDIHALVAISGHSSQICRKYLRGEVLPDPIKLIEIATQLHVTPGWLLFGEIAQDQGNKITIRSNLLHYICSRTCTLYNDLQPHHDIADFLVELIRDVSQIDANEEQSKKIIDLALASATRFKSHRI